ncbi:hypothetical protein CTEN210_18162 [Chaetoceros tenuissimus]|uniref:Uncharacterized protein n=1 Tax=Chaetoceros tenuissimus TaxID=426638 RepID=A0AAD3DE91_9STRA|nr:hypothetical protein CTEN210_18162 [Chaetoceros tenuissimus]
MVSTASVSNMNCSRKHSDSFSNALNQPLAKNRSKKNFTVGYYWESQEVPSCLPSLGCAAEITREGNDSLATNENGSQTALHGTCSIRAGSSMNTSMNQKLPLTSPNCVTLMNIANAHNSTQIEKNQMSDSNVMTSQKNNSAPRRKMKRERTYDMNLVPMVQKNPSFLKTWREIALSDSNDAASKESLKKNQVSMLSLPSLVHCDNMQSVKPVSDVLQEDEEPDTVSEVATDLSSSSMSVDTSASTNTFAGPCHSCHPHMQSPVSTSKRPFGPNADSVIWAPSCRADWEESVDEMVAICSAAAWHQYNLLPYNVRRKEKFNEPISHVYVKDRIQIDDPLRGYQIRHKTGGWLQGFIMMTNFTTWTHYFKWDSQHKANGMNATDQGKNDEGILANELESQIRAGDPLAEGVVWPTIAEISLVGALGCGEYLLQMALDDIARRQCYDYVVLEATVKSRPFYEKFGFVRVGAVCKYGNEKDIMDEKGEVQDVGYRHWSYAQTTEEGLDQIGAPSYMMARRIKKFSTISTCAECGTQGTPSFTDHLGAQCFIAKKPAILPLGGLPRKRSRAMSSASVSSKKKARSMSCASVDSKKEKNCKVLETMNIEKEVKDTLAVSNATVDAKPEKTKSTIPETITTDDKNKKASDIRTPLKVESNETTQNVISANGKEVEKPKKEVVTPIVVTTLRKSKSKAIELMKAANASPVIPAQNKAESKTVSKEKKKPVQNVPTTPKKKSTMKLPHPLSPLSPKAEVSYRKQNLIQGTGLSKSQLFFNKIITPKPSKLRRNSNQYTSQYYYVIDFDYKKRHINAIPLYINGNFKGKHEGRPKWKVHLLPKKKGMSNKEYYKSMDGIVNSSIDDWDMVKAKTVTRSSWLDKESWDILG